MICGSKLDSGTFGIVYEAEKVKGTISTPHGLQVRTSYALKRNLKENSVYFIGALRELDVFMKLKHCYIVPLDTVILDNPFVDELGVTVSKKCFSPLKRKDRKGQVDDKIHFVFPLATCNLSTYIYSSNIKDIKRFMVQILLGLENMHNNGIIHRDVKPSNILYFQNLTDIDGSPGVCTICDLGFSKPFTKQGYQSNMVCTSMYRPPEVILNSYVYDYRVDVWSVGCVLFEMVTRTSFLSEHDDNNNKLLKNILESHPEKVSLRQLRDMNLRYNQEDDRSITRIFHASGDGNRRSFHDRLMFNSAEYRANFLKYIGSDTLFIDLMSKMLKFDPMERCTMTQALDHEFFSDLGEHISKVRNKYEVKLPSYTFRIPKLIERKWGCEFLSELYEEKDKKVWHSHRERITFQTLDIYDRYLNWTVDNRSVAPNALESEEKGLYLTKKEARQRFYTILYMCIKYFCATSLTTSIREILYDYMSTECQVQMENFERSILVHVLNYQMYRPTLYEESDAFGVILEASDIERLLVIFMYNNNIEGRTPATVLGGYFGNLRSMSREEAMKGEI